MKCSGQAGGQYSATPCVEEWHFAPTHCLPSLQIVSGHTECSGVVGLSDKSRFNID